NAVYPFYLGNVSSIGEVGGTIGFILIALVWFYLVALSLLAGAVINALRYELHDTGRIKSRSRSVVLYPPTDPADQPQRPPVTSRSFAWSWRAWTVRTVPERDRMTSDSVDAFPPPG